MQPHIHSKAEPPRLKPFLPDNWLVCQPGHFLSTNHLHTSIKLDISIFWRRHTAPVLLRVEIFDIFCGAFQYRYLTTPTFLVFSKCQHFYRISVFTPVRERGGDKLLSQQAPGSVLVLFSFPRLASTQSSSSKCTSLPQHLKGLMDWNVWKRNVVSVRIIEALTWEPHRHL